VPHLLTAPRRRFARGLLRAALCCAFGAIAACSPPLEAIDNDVNTLVERRSALIDGGSVAPSRAYPPKGSTNRPEQTAYTPDTVNPPAEGLGYQLAAADRNVADRLESYAELPDNAIQIDLETAFRIAQETGREYLDAEEDYILAAIRLLIERHRFSPRFFNDLRASADGTFDPEATQALRVINELRVTQQLPYGGNVEAALLYDAIQDLRDAASDDYRQATSIVLSGDIPLLRDAGPIAQEGLIQAEREVVFAARAFERFRRTFLVSIAADFFDLVALQSSIRNQLQSLDSRRESAVREQALVEAGRRSAFDARNLEQSVLSAEQSLINLREAFLLALDRFKIRLGIPVETPVQILEADLPLPEPAASPGEAAELALRYRLDLQTERDRIDDGRRDVENAYNQLLPDLDLAGSVVFNTTENDDVGRFDFRFDDSDYSASITFGLPLDRRIERLNLRSALIGLQRDIRDYEEFRDGVILESRDARRSIDQRRFALRIAEQRVEINRLRLEQLKLQEGDALNLNEAEDDLLEARNDLDDAIRDLRTDILNYLLATGQLRVRRDGTFQPLPGMEIEP